jgi:hypothetical protein
VADNGSPPTAHHRHAHHPTRTDRRRLVLVIAVGVLVVAGIAAVLVAASWDRSPDAVADQPVAATAATPTSLPTPTVTVTATETASETASGVPSTFADAMQQVGIPLDVDTGWAIAQGICVRLGQPAQYDQFKMAEGIERLFPAVSDEQSHAFVAMVATSVCDR